MNGLFRGRLAWLSKLVVLLVASLPGCAPSIGDHCSVSTDCSPQGDRLCDSTQPGGYCTVFNCEPNACPSDSVCVAFEEATCGNAQSIRFQRTFCMATCEKQGDCRGGYTCLDLTDDSSRKVVDINPSSHRICTVEPATSPPASADAGAPAAADAAPPVCFPSDAWASSDSFGDATVSE